MFQINPTTAVDNERYGNLPYSAVAILAPRPFMCRISGNDLSLLLAFLKTISSKSIQGSP